uniref:Secreted protein n=1 Tax=Plectus sambesii TaxID=2011161 RepID=A0A914VCC8_9BILA
MPGRTVQLVARRSGCCFAVVFVYAAQASVLDRPIDHPLVLATAHCFDEVMIPASGSGAVCRPGEVWLQVRFVAKSARLAIACVRGMSQHVGDKSCASI